MHYTLQGALWILGPRSLFTYLQTCGKSSPPWRGSALNVAVLSSLSCWAILTHLALVPSPDSTRGGPQEWNVLSHFIINSTFDNGLHAQLGFLYNGCRPELPQGECT